MDLPSCQRDRQWKLCSIRPHPDPISGYGVLHFSVVRNHRTVVHDVHGHLEEFSYLLPDASLLQLPIPIGVLRRMPGFFAGTALEFLNVRLGMDRVACQHLLSEIMAARDSVVWNRGFFVAVDLEVTTVSFEDLFEPQPHRPCGASEAARRKLESESFVPAAGDEGAGTCAICLEYLSRGRRNKRRLARMPCTHVFHYRCISRWLDTSKTCPMCRRELDD